MLLRNTAGGVYLFAWNAAGNAPRTGDAANISGYRSLDGGAETAGFATVHPTEIGHGIYWQPLTATETNGNSFAFAVLFGKCAARTLPTSSMASVNAKLNFSC